MGMYACSKCCVRAPPADDASLQRLVRKEICAVLKLTLSFLKTFSLLIQETSVVLKIYH